jgi:hypothetical protein
MVTLSGFGTGDHVYYSINATTTATFAAKDGNGATRLPGIPVYSGILNVGNGDQAMIGTHFGIYSTEDITAPNPVWVSQNMNGMPQVMAVDIKQQTTPGGYFTGVSNPGYVYVGTHGRGILRTSNWQTQSVDEPKPTVQTGPVIQLMVYPNPAIANASIQFKVEKQGEVLIRMYDLSGKVVYQEELKNVVPGSFIHELDLSTMNKGNYIVNVITPTGKLNGKLLKL